MYMCVGLRERMSYGMYCTCIIGTRRSKSALPIKTCWILWIPNPVTLFCLSTSPFFFYCLTTWQWIRGMDTVIFASNNMNGMQSQFRESDKMIKLILVFMQQFAVLICAVRQSQSRHSVSGCHIRHCLALSVAGDCVCVCVCVCVWSHLGSISGGSWRLCPAAEESRVDRAQAQRLSPLRRRATTALFSFRLQPPHKHTRTHPHIATGGSSVSSWFSCI